MSESIITLPDDLLEIAIFDHAYLKHHVRQDCFNNPRFGEGWDIQEPEELIDRAHEILSDPDTEFYLRRTSEDSGITAFIYHHASRGVIAINEDSPERATLYRIEMGEDQRSLLEIDLNSGLSYEKVDAQKMQAWLDQPEIKEKLQAVDADKVKADFESSINDAWRRRLRTDIAKEVKDAGLTGIGLVKGKYPGRQLPEETMAFIDQTVERYRRIHPHAFSDADEQAGKTVQKIHDELVDRVATELVNEKNGKPLTVKNALKIIATAQKCYEHSLKQHSDLVQALAASNARIVADLSDGIISKMSGIYTQIQQDDDFADAFDAILADPKYAGTVSFERIGTQHMHVIRKEVILEFAGDNAADRLHATSQEIKVDMSDMVNEGFIASGGDLTVAYNTELFDDPVGSIGTSTDEVKVTLESDEGSHSRDKNAHPKVK